MALTLEDGLRVLSEAAAAAGNVTVELTDDYLQLIAAVEALPENRHRADKSGRWRGSRAFWRFVADGRIVVPTP